MEINGCVDYTLASNLVDLLPRYKESLPMADWESNEAANQPETISGRGIHDVLLKSKVTFQITPHPNDQFV